MSAPSTDWDGAAPGGELTVDELSHRGAFRALAPAWEALCRRAGTSGPFFRSEWFAVQAAALAGPRSLPRRCLRLLVAHRRGVVAGLLPLLFEERRIAGIPARVLRSLSDDHAQRFDLIAGGAEAVGALFSHLQADTSWDVLELRDVLVDGDVAGVAGGLALFRLAAEAGFPTGIWPAQRSPYLLLPASADALDASLEAKFRANLRRRARRLAEEAGPLTLERVTGAAGAAEIDAALADGFALEASGWKGQRGTAIAADPALVARYRALARVFARRGELSLHFLRAGTRRVAFHYALESSGVYYLFKPGYDEALARFGLGHLLCHEVARALIARGAREIDFLGDDLPWKSSWTQLVRPHAFHYVLRPTPLGRAIAAWKFHALPALRRARSRFGRQPVAPDQVVPTGPLGPVEETS